MWLPPLENGQTWSMWCFSGSNFLPFKSLDMTVRLVAFGMYRERFFPCHRANKMSAANPAMNCS